MKHYHHFYREAGKLILLAAILSFIPGLSRAQFLDGDTSSGKYPTAVPAKLDQLIAAYAGAGLYNGTVLVRRNDRTLLKKAYGFADISSGKKNTTETIFALYSITKSMTATLVLQLIEEGKLNIHDTISRYFLSFPSADSITVENLLTHTSGLYPYNNDYSMPVNSEEAMIRFLAKKPLRFLPGSRFEYCNTGYYLLGFLIQKTTGLSYAEAIHRYIFAPLQMQHSGLDFTALKSKDKATGYAILYPDTCRVAKPYDYEELFSAGGAWATVEDLFKFYSGIQHHKLINEMTTRQAFTRFRSNYGYGWFIDSIAGRQIISHSGGAAGFRTYFVQIPADSTCIVLLSNCENSDVQSIKNNILNLLIGLPYIVPVGLYLESKSLSKFEGTYLIQPGLSLYVSTLGARLTGRLSGQQESVLLAETESRFLVDGLDGYLQFIVNKENSCDTVLIKRKGRIYTGRRIEASWGLVGSAVAGGWEGPDIILKRAGNRTNIWQAENVEIGNGVIKFRFNNDWTLNFGLEEHTGKLIGGGKDIPVLAGIYTIELELGIDGNVTYRITKQDKL